jgi:hypothetical protein
VPTAYPHEAEALAVAAEEDALRLAVFQDQGNELLALIGGKVGHVQDIQNHVVKTLCRGPSPNIGDKP